MAEIRALLLESASLRSLVMLEYRSSAELKSESELTSSTTLNVTVALDEPNSRRSSSCRRRRRATVTATPVISASSIPSRTEARPVLIAARSSSSTRVAFSP